MKYMEHDWELIDRYEDKYRCKRCNGTVTYDDVNIPCGTKTRSWYRNCKGERVGYLVCVERE